MTIISSNHWFWNWHQAITWANVDPDLWRHIAPLGHNQLNSWVLNGFGLDIITTPSADELRGLKLINKDFPAWGYLY